MVSCVSVGIFQVYSTQTFGLRTHIFLKIIKDPQKAFICVNDIFYIYYI